MGINYGIFRTMGHAGFISSTAVHMQYVHIYRSHAYVCMYVRLVGNCIYIYIYVCMYVRVLVYLYILMRVRRVVYKLMYVCIHIFICLYVCMFVCVYIYIYIYPIESPQTQRS